MLPAEAAAELGAPPGAQAAELEREAVLAAEVAGAEPPAEAAPEPGDRVRQKEPALRSRLFTMVQAGRESARTMASLLFGTAIPDLESGPSL